ncbi:MAG: hypothetical protein ACREOW_01680 [Thermodesulfobacteriota bacterium]
MKQKKIRAKWLRLTEKTNALDYLEKAYDFIRQTETSVFAWKWVILALHSALYGFAICACAGSNPDSVRTKKGYLIDFDKALELCQNPSWMRMFIHSKHLRLSSSQGESIRYLRKEFRNNFEHFSPKGWSIELHGMPRIVMDVLDVICFLTLDTGNFNLTMTQKKKVKSIVSQSKRILRQRQLYKEAEKAKSKQI